MGEDLDKVDCESDWDIRANIIRFKIPSGNFIGDFYSNNSYRFLALVLLRPRGVPLLIEKFRYSCHRGPILHPLGQRDARIVKVGQAEFHSGLEVKRNM